jgi:hypothetical protein
MAFLRQMGAAARPTVSFHNHPRHTARTNTNTSAATMIQINAGSFSYMAAGQYAVHWEMLMEVGKAPAGG